MRKLLLAAIVILVATAETFAGPVITIRIEIGKKSEDCARFGFCSTSVEGSWRASSMQIDENANALLVNIDKELTQGKEQYFLGYTVNFEEAYALPADVLKALGRKSGITIEPGAYTLMKTRTGYQITIPLK